MNKNIKKYLLRFFAFFAIPYISLLLIDLILSHNYVWKGNYFCSWNHLYYDKEDDDLLIFGSSRAQVHFVSNIISDSLNLKVHNFGLPGASINYSYIQLLEYLKYHKTPPKYATLEVCFHTLMPRPLPYHWQMMPKMLYNFRMYKYCGHPDYFPLYYFTVPLWRYVHYFDDLKLFKRDTYISCKDCGYVGEGDKYVSSRNLELGGLCASYEPYNEDQYKMLQNFILLCKKNNIKLSLIWSPEYYKYQYLLENREDLRKCFDNLAQKDTLPYVYFADYEICNDSLNFKNAMHLGVSGSKKFTRELYIPAMKKWYGL